MPAPGATGLAARPVGDMLVVENLRVAFPSRTGLVDAVRGVSLSLGREKLGIVGESGSGKSTVGRAVMGLLPPQARVTADRLAFEGIDLLAGSPAQWRELRGGRIGMVLQDPKYSLNPVMRVGAQIEESLGDHGQLRGSAARARVLELLAAVRIRDPRRVAAAWPHELSGGMGQRVMIAMMLAGEPDLLIADEPTSALDVTVQLQVLAILDDLVSRRGMGLIFISHDLELVATFCDRVAIMYAGRIVEMCRAAELHQARHPYTRGLLGCLPRLDRPRERLQVLDRDPAWLEAGP
jgi:peptide/nickel transport system ATP-binding protein